MGVPCRVAYTQRYTYASHVETEKPEPRLKVEDIFGMKVLITMKYRTARETIMGKQSLPSQLRNLESGDSVILPAQDRTYQSLMREVGGISTRNNIKLKSKKVLIIEDDIASIAVKVTRMEVDLIALKQEVKK